MLEHEYRRTVFYQMRGHEKFEDEHKNFPIIYDESSIVADAVTYLMDGSSYLKFPGAARAVAIATADFVSRNFNLNFYDVLNDPNLMHQNDPYFRTYTEDKANYDSILELIPLDKINWSSERMGITLRLIKEEYMMDDDGISILERFA